MGVTSYSRSTAHPDNNNSSSSISSSSSSSSDDSSKSSSSSTSGSSAKDRSTSRSSAAPAASVATMTAIAAAAAAAAAQRDVCFILHAPLRAAILSDLKTGLISRSLSDCPGLIPLITNLCTSSYPDVPSAVLRHRFSPEVLNHMEAYIRGAMHALYSFRAPQCMLGLAFEEVALNLFRLAGVITLGIQRRHSGPLQSPVGPQAAAHAGLGSAVGRGLLSICCCHKSSPEGTASGHALSEPESLSSPASISLSPSSYGSSSKPTAAAAAAAAPESYWLNPCGKGCVLRPGDRLVIIATSVAVAECLQYATRLPWVPRVYGMRSLISHALNVAGGGDRRSLFAPKKAVKPRPASLSHKFSLLAHAEAHKQTSPSTPHALTAAFQAPNATRMQARLNGLAVLPGAPPAATHLPPAPLSQSTAADRTTGASLVPQSPRLGEQLHEQERMWADFDGDDREERHGLFSRDPALGQAPPRIPSFAWDDARLSGERLLLQQQNSISSAAGASSSSARPSGSRLAELAGKLAHAGSPAAPHMQQPAQQQLTTQTSTGRPPSLQRLHPASSSQVLRSSIVAAPPGLCFETEEDPVVPVLGSEAVDEREQQEVDSLLKRQTERRVSDSSDEVLNHTKQADINKVRRAYASTNSSSSNSSSSNNNNSSSNSNRKAYESRFIDPSRPLIFVCGWPKFLHRLLRKLGLSSRHNVIVFAAELT
ncbi:hypothetical protein ACSSS7_001025 [Eimeria intestinalis]